MTAPDTVLTLRDASAAVAGTPWRYITARLLAAVPVPNLAAGVDAAAVATSACGPDGDAHLRIDVRAGHVELCLTTLARGAVTARDVELAHAVAAALRAAGYDLTRLTAPTARSVQVFEVAIDAMDIPAVRPFWKAVLGYVDEPEDGSSVGRDVEPDALVDPAGTGPSVWFQQMDEPRTQRNRIHFDLVVPHDDADARIRAALDAGGVLVSDAAARSFWILADPEGNELCVCTWQDRD